jgi:hypothetical protein
MEAIVYFQALHQLAAAAVGRVEMVKLIPEMVDRAAAVELATLCKQVGQEILHRQVHHKETTAEMETEIVHGPAAAAVARLPLVQQQQQIKVEMAAQAQPILIQDHRLLMLAAAAADKQTAQAMLEQAVPAAVEMDLLQEMARVAL